MSCFFSSCNCEQFRGPDGLYNGPTEAIDPNPEFVLLEGKEHGNRFFTSNDGKLLSGWYRLIGFAETVEEAQRKLYGGPITSSAVKA